MEAGSNASRTAVLVCQGRAAADGLIGADRWRDPVASALLTDHERAPVEQVRSGARPDGAAPRMRFEMVRACAELMAPRTAAIDVALSDHPAPQVVILGAGLDSRAWRLTVLGTSTVYEVDHPASQADKRQRVGDRAPVAASVRYVPVDFIRDSLADRLHLAGHDATIATTWVWEGVIPYLTPAQVMQTLATVRTLSTPGSRLIANYNSTSALSRAGRSFMRLMSGLSRSEDPVANEPRRSAWTPATMGTLLEQHGFAVQLHVDLVALAIELGIERPRKSLHESHVTVGMAE